MAIKNIIIIIIIIYDPNKKAVITSRDVVINEKPKLLKNFDFLKSSSTEMWLREALPQVGDPDHRENPDGILGDELEDESNDPDYVPDTEVSLETPSTPRRSNRTKKPKSYQDYVTFACHKQQEVNLEDIPSSVSEALSRPDSARWKKAMDDEMQSFAENEAWDLVDTSRSGPLVECKWVFKTKIDCDDQVCYRARLVAKGYTQREGVDYDETFFPVIRYSSLQLLLALSVKLDLDIVYLDVKTAYLNGDLQETVFMRQPEGYCLKGNES